MRELPRQLSAEELAEPQAPCVVKADGLAAGKGVFVCETEAELAAALAGLAGPVLLVDDLVDSGWTMALAGRALRRAGAPGVLPLALAVAG